MSDEVTDFLRSVEQLKDRRQVEDEARSRELEEKILQEKRERQARRAERARSISPQKSSPASTPPPPTSSHHRYNSSQTSDVLKLSSSPPALGSPRSPTSRASQQQNTYSSSGTGSSAALGSGLDFSATASSSPAFVSSSSPTKENESPFDADSKTVDNSASLTRTPTLSWQRRPPSSGQSGSDRPRSRPLSIVAAENAAARSSNASAGSSASPLLPEPKNSDTPVSRDQIAQALSSKDPSWFRQTPDRGLISAAYRRSQIEDEDRQDLTAARAQLPGMSRGSSAEPDANSSLFSPPQASSLSSSLQVGGGSAKLSPSLPLTPAQRLDPPGDSVVPLSSGRTSPTRPLSPTKGAGGFVQSAMMKRSDSVKRWSVTSPPGLQRADSVASNRAGLESPRRPSTIPQTTSNSRPTSSHGRDSANNSRPSTPTRPQAPPLEEAAKDTAGEDELKTTPPLSPSKTMDPRRWSPTKTSSWLDAQLKKPESPKPKAAPPINNQPAWMVELNKAKAQKASNPGSVDVARASSVARKHEVKTGGLMRSSPMGAASVSPATTAASPLPNRSGLGSYHSPSTSISSTSSKLGNGPVTKPTTPPKADFRANLKPRQPLPTENKGGDANELQNVFGSLRRTKTQNYVAPDTLKDNILRGKSALNVTGGPKPREKKDELKDAILQKKKEFQQAKSEGRGITTNARPQNDDHAVPEGVAKRLEMSRTGGSQPASTNRKNSADRVTLIEAPSQPSETPASNRASTVSVIKPADADVVASPPTKPAGPAGRSPRIGGSSALADRFNPALAGILARGPPGAAPSGGSASSSGMEASSSAPVSAPSTAELDGPPAPGPQLTHMTKNRARGPRRKAPSNVQPPKSSNEPAMPVAQSVKSPPATAPKKADLVTPQVVSLIDSSRKTAPAPAQVQSSRPASGVISLVDSSRAKTAEKPAEPPKASVISLVDSSRMTAGSSPRSPTKIHEQVAAIAAKNNQPAKPSLGSKAEGAPSTASPPSSPKKIDVKRMSRFLEDSANQSAVAAPVEAPRPLSPSKTGGSRPLPEVRPLSPQKTGGSARPLPAAPISPKKEWQTGGPTAAPASPASFASSVSRRSKGFSDTPIRPAGGQQPLQSPASTRRIEPPSPALTSPALSSPMRSPTKHAQEVSALLKDFFGAERPGREFRADTAEILSRRPSVDQKVSTTKAELFRLSSDGKKQPVPSQHERVLFEREMYLCPHTFINGSGKKVTEVYFWSGDEVPETEVQDVQVFLNREARSLGGKLVKLQQGKETAEFLQAMGGIVTIRRGSSNKYDSLASSMFCGRRYLGQVAFDEVDFTPTSLCSGFPYLITQAGSCYLWKGKGSNVDELSCARLIGMDLALMGELIEIEDGDEPAEFWALFDRSGASKAGSADHWRLKPKYDKYCGRLFCSDLTRREQIVEIHPFDQRDLSPDGIYVLDAFFEMYIIVGHRSQTQYAAFHNALDFAQEYAILAAGMEDRPFVPISTVVLEGIPRDLKSVFRKWSDAASPTRTATPRPTSSVSIKRGRSLRIVPLTVALQALAE